MQAYCGTALTWIEKCDRATPDLLAILLEHMGVAPGDYKAATLWFAERLVPAFMAGKRGRPSAPWSNHQVMWAVEREIHEGRAKNVKDAVRKLYPDLNEEEFVYKCKQVSAARKEQEESRKQTKALFEKSFPKK
jgi:hypothetical protein